MRTHPPSHSPPRPPARSRTRDPREGGREKCWRMAAALASVRALSSSDWINMLQTPWLPTQQKKETETRHAVQQILRQSPKKIRGSRAVAGWRRKEREKERNFHYEGRSFPHCPCPSVFHILFCPLHLFIPAQRCLYNSGLPKWCLIGGKSLSVSVEGL